MNFNTLEQLSSSYKASRILHVAVDLKLFDLLASEHRTAEGIAETLKTDPRATELLCNALTGMALLEKSEKRFSNTETAQRYLVTSSPLYYGWIIRHGSNLWNSWGRLADSIKSGKPIERPSISERDDEDMENFIMGMHSIIVARGDAEMLADKLDLDRCKTLLDLGGGPGTFSIIFCQYHKNLKATVFDLPETIKIAKKNINRYPDVTGRIDFVAGDYFANDLPTGFDLVFVSNIIHSNNEEQNIELMKKIFGSLNPGGRVVIKDHILNEDLTLPANGSIFSLNMLLHTNGRDYSYKEVEGWLKSAGFSDVSSPDLPKDTPYGIIIARHP